MVTEPIVLLTCGPADHGIVRFGADLGRAARRAGFRGTVRHHRDPLTLNDIVPELPAGTRLVHLQINDWLLTGSGRSASDRLTEFARRLRLRGTELSITLHDLPHAAGGPELYRRRSRDYFLMARSALAVVVSSRHEQLLLADAVSAVDGSEAAGPVGRSVTVIRLPVAGRSVAAEPIDGLPPASVGILGFLYPGKGHDGVLTELTGARVNLVALGRPSNGHDWMLPELQAQAAEVGIGWHCTGFLPDTVLDRYLAAIEVPVAPAPQVSASASINTWIAAGRRPLVLDSRYSRELEAVNPGAIRRYGPGQLRDAVQAALAEPRLTWLAPGFQARSTTASIAAEHLSLLRRLSAPGPGR